jgi:hypothetical protein
MYGLDKNYELYKAPKGFVGPKAATPYDLAAADFFPDTFPLPQILPSLGAATAGGSLDSHLEDFNERYVFVLSDAQNMPSAASTALNPQFIYSSVSRRLWSSPRATPRKFR